MRSNKGFSLIELMIVVGIISILTATAMPMFRDYILRVRIAESINAIAMLARDGQIAFGEGSLKTAVDLEQLAKNTGLSLGNAGCTDGFQKSYVYVPKNKLSHIGITLPYIRTVHLYGQTSKPCTGSNMHDDSIEIYFTLDTEALGVPNKSNNKDYNFMELSVSKEVIYQDLQGKITRKEVGSVLSCGIYPSSGGSMTNFDVPISALPAMCRYFRISGTSPRTLRELSAY